MRLEGMRPNDEFLYSTVGAVALDKDGNVAVVASTGRTSMKMPGRIGDTPLVGSRAYADNLLGGASATGLGALMRVVLSKKALELIPTEGDPARAARKALEKMKERVEGGAGLIIMDRNGNAALA